MALSLLAESWTWYAFACLIVITRYISRYLQLGSIKNFQPEDYVMIWVFAFYTVLVATMNIVAHLDTNLMLPEDVITLTPESIQSRIRGSKLVLVVEQSMIMTQWGCKICLLLLYNKLTFGLKQQLAVKIVGAYVVITLIVMEILYLGVWCRPFSGYWKVPVENVQCSAAIHHLITNAVFNITSDVMMLCIPLPLLIASQLPKANKLILCVLFSLGVFVVCSPSSSLPDPKPKSYTEKTSTLTLVSSDPLRRPQQILLLRATLLPNVDLLVHPRSLHRRLRGQHAHVLVPHAPALQAPRLQRHLLGRTLALALQIRTHSNDVHWRGRLAHGHDIEGPGVGAGE
ncbi:hypothetical protein ONS95_002071 [Cadophora gregata]|uniref:uncharacterized protein n=1 Tax=Cadophora gregata TaxID=51156 RepID=UPI0026DC073A|nr:uncharacterized protein ONS95_002071 [Cadophora gregata]KAK0111730.1 hypothetical protein ONS95_002071 [Cadophora gregata]